MVKFRSFLKSATPLFNDTAILPNAPYLKRIIRWTIDYGKKYGRAPREYLEKVFGRYKEEVGPEEPEVDLIAKVLRRLNDEYLNHEIPSIITSH